MFYIAIRQDAAEEFIAERTLQSADFDAASKFAVALRASQETVVSSKIECFIEKNGLVIVGRNPEKSQYIVIDVAQTNFLSGTNDHSLILYLQRIMRFAVKFWNKSILTPSEMVIGSNTAVVFPHPISQKTGIRIAIDINPDHDRLSKRNLSGRFLLVYKLGKEEGLGADERASLSNFRKFLQDLPAFEDRALTATSLGDAERLISGLTSIALQSLPTKVDIHQAYETWLDLLTISQKDFVTTKLTGPSRIDGPAGTGKTASLVMAAVHALKQAESENQELQSIFFTHSEASRQSILTVIEAMGGGEFLSDQASIRRLRVETLQGFCADILRQEISTTEFVDPDAYDAKHLQLMYVEEAINRVDAEISTYSKFMSDEFSKYWEAEEIGVKISIVQHEIAVVIKGRAGEDLDTYKKIPALPNGLPTKNESDKGFVWQIYLKYREQLVSIGQFDTDDVVISALSQLSTPIWRRRRLRDGFDTIYVDETHLFNMNELSVFHHLTRSEEVFPIAFAVDRSQAIGDRGWADDIDVASLMPEKNYETEETRTNLNGIFRCSPDIVNLAFTITSSGASLFANFQDPMRMSHSNMSYEEEKRSKKPWYKEFENDETMLQGAFAIAEEMKNSVGSSRGNIAIVAFSDGLFNDLAKKAMAQNKPFELLKHRGDYEVVSRAKNGSKFVISASDYIGGLEFDGVVLVGVDDGRVPAYSDAEHAQSRAYMTFAAHNKLYVAVTRARYQIAMLGVQERGRSKILDAAFSQDAIEHG